MTKKVTIIDYGCGNIFSLERILKELNCTVEITNNFDEIVLKCLNLSYVQC